MIAPLWDLKAAVLMLALATPRLLAASLIIPFLSPRMMPRLARNSIAVSLALILLPMLRANEKLSQLSGYEWPALILKEVFLGVVIGYVTALGFWAVEAIGAYIDNQRGADIASSLNPILGTNGSPLGALLLQSFLAFFFVAGGFLTFIDALYNSYLIWPITELLPQIHAESGITFLHLLDKLMTLIVVLSAPVIITMFVSEFGLGIVSRFVPQLNVFFVAMPIKSGVGFFVLILYAAFLFHYIDADLGQLRSLLQQLAQELR